VKCEIFPLFGIPFSRLSVLFRLMFVGFISKNRTASFLAPRPSDWGTPVSSVFLASRVGSGDSDAYLSLLHRTCLSATSHGVQLLFFTLIKVPLAAVQDA